MNKYTVEQLETEVNKLHEYVVASVIMNDPIPDFIVHTQSVRQSRRKIVSNCGIKLLLKIRISTLRKI